MSKFLTSIKWRLILISLIVLILAFLLIIILTSTIIENTLINKRVSDCMQNVNALAVQFSYNLLNQNTENLYNDSIEQGMALGGRILILDQYGIVQVDNYSRLNGVQLANSKEVREVLGEGKEAAYGYHRVGDGKDKVWAGYYVSAIVENGETIGAVLFVESIQDVVNETSGIRVSYIWIYSASTLIVIFIIYIFTDRIAGPLGELRDNVVAVSGGDFSRRVQVKGNDEVANLGRAFNDMAVRLEGVDQQRTEFVSNASHELKTPLSSAKILIESLLYQEGVEEHVYKEFLGEINTEVDRMTALINDLLLMTKLQNIAEGDKKELIEIVPMVEEVVDSFEGLAAQKDITVRLTNTSSPALRGFSTHLRQAISNLIDNAIKYTAEGGQVFVRVYRVAGDVLIEVRDTGEGIPIHEQENIFERFYRVDKARARETGGTGLGLHIVRTIAHAHSGRIDVKSKEGEGSVFTLTLPLRGQRKEEE